MKRTDRPKKVGRPRKPADAVLAGRLEIRCEESEKQAFILAAQAAGLELSGWLRERLRRVARKELQDLGMPVAFLDRHLT